MSHFKLNVFCNNQLVGTYKGKKEKMQKIMDALGWDPLKKESFEIDLDKLAKTYIENTPSIDLDNKEVTYFEYKIEEYKITDSKEKQIYSVTLPWFITRRNNGELVLSNYLTTEDVQIQRKKRKD